MVLPRMRDEFLAEPRRQRVRLGLVAVGDHQHAAAEFSGTSA